MCGFLGWVEPGGLTLDAARLDRARDSLRHRGPDDARSLRDEVCHLGFRRLAIIDLSEHGAQPMCCTDDRLRIVFNGEIYNHIELRRELEATGVLFRSHSDTEVLLALYAREGRAMLGKLNGMFALAIYDRKERKILLARDRFGEKPLFIWLNSNGLAFGSELKALRGLPGFPSEPDPLALGEYFQLGFVPGHRCIWPGVFKLPPATSVEFDIKTGMLSEPERYWSPPEPVQGSASMSAEELVAQTGSLLDSSVMLRLRADVPLGCFLSGGIDSSLIAESAARQSDGIIASLTVKFPGWSDDEEPIARETAAQLGLRSVVVPLAPDGLAGLPELCAHFDEPTADASMLPTAMICKAAREQFTVVLSGDGGDEAFGGYDNHVRAARFDWVDSVPSGVRAFAAGVLSLAPRDSRAERFGRRLPWPTGRWGIGAKLYPFETTLATCLSPAFRACAKKLCADYDHMLGPVSNCSLTEAQRTDLRVYLPDDVLLKSDRMSMLNSLEVRAPFLDHRLIEHGLSLPKAMRVSQGRGKHILRLLAQKRGLPRSVWSGSKRGFGLPLHSWLFAGYQSNQLRSVFMGEGERDPLLASAPLAALWASARHNPSLTAAVFRVLVYRWWRQGIKGAGPI